MEFRTVLSSDCYSYDSETGLYNDLRDSDTGLAYLYDNGIPLKVTGIIRPKEDAVGQMLTGSIGYTSQLTEYVINHSAESEIVKAQQASPDKDIISGLMFKSAPSEYQERNEMIMRRSYFIIKDWQILLVAIAGFILYKKKYERSDYETIRSIIYR